MKAREIKTRSDIRKNMVRSIETNVDVHSGKIIKMTINEISG